MRYLSLVSVLLVLLSVKGISQESFKFHLLETERGVKAVTSICRDNEGFLWVACRGIGLMRHNSYSETWFVPDSGNPQSLSSAHVRKILKDSRGNLWVVTRNGINLFEPQTETFKVFLHDPEDSLTVVSSNVIGVMEDSKERLWVTTYQGIDLYDYETGNFVRAFSPKTENHAPYSIIEDPDGNYWVLGAFNGIYQFFPEDGHAAYYPDNQMPNDSVMVGKYGVADSEEYIWIYTNGRGLIRFNRNDCSFYHYPVSSSGEGVNGSWVSGFLEWDSRYYLFGVDQGGVNVLDKVTGRFSYITSEMQWSGLSSNGISTLFKDEEGILWLGTTRKGVQYYNPQMHQIKTYQQTVLGAECLYVNSLVYDVTGCFFEDSEGLIWIGTDGGGISVFDRDEGTFRNYKHDLYDSTSLVSNVVRSFSEDSKGRIWISTWGNGVCVFDKETETFIRPGWGKDVLNPNEIPYIWSMKIDKQDRKWISFVTGAIIIISKTGELSARFELAYPGGGTFPVFNEYTDDSFLIVHRNGVSIYNEEKKAIENIINVTQFATSAAIDTSGNVWLGTEKNGLLVFDKKGNEIERYNTDNGLSDNYINAVLINKNGQIWISTNNGLNHLVPEEKKVFTYDKYNGLISSQFFFQSAYATRDGEFYFGGTDGFCRFYPDSIEVSRNVPQVYFTELLVDNKVVQPNASDGIIKSHIRFAEEISLRYKTSVVSIGFVAINFTYPDKCKYSYMLEGFDPEWKEVSAGQRLATYTNLDPGKYIFKVKASNSDNVWSNTYTELKIVVPPPFWRRRGFLIFVVIICFLIIVAVIMLRERKLRMDKKLLVDKVVERTKLIEEQKEELKAQNEELEGHRNNLEKLVDIRTIELNKAKNKAEESDRLKTAFLANISHEIRTPMNAIIGFSNLLLDPELEEEDRNNFVSLIKKNGSSLLYLIDDILDISKIEAGEQKVVRKPVLLLELLLGIYSNFAYRNENEAIKVEFKNNGLKDNYIIYSDEFRIQQIMSNLITNAIKYTPSGVVQINIGVNKDELLLSVKDTGYGITQEEMRLIFNPFTKLVKTRDKEIGGVGLGLAISKKLADLLGGELRVQSKPGEGSEFTLALPLSRVTASGDEIQTE